MVSEAYAPIPVRGMLQDTGHLHPSDGAPPMLLDQRREGLCATWTFWRLESDTEDVSMD